MRTLFREFRDELASTRYPFADAATLAPRENTELGISQGTFLDAAIYLIGAAAPLYLGSVLVGPRQVTLTVKDSKTLSVATTTFDPLAAPETLVLADSRDRPAGVLIADPVLLRNFGAWSAGTYTFTAQTAGFVASCVTPLPSTGVRGLLDRQDALFVGDVWLVGDDGVVLREVVPGEIRVDVVGDPLSLRALCQPLSLFQTPRFIRTINGCPPDQFGNFNLTVGDHENEQTVLRIYPSGDGLVVEMAGAK